MIVVGRKPALSAEQLAQAEAWAAIGTSMAGAARYFGITPATLRQYLRGAHKHYRRRERATDSAEGVMP